MTALLQNLHNFSHIYKSASGIQLAKDNIQLSQQPRFILWLLNGHSTESDLLMMFV